jgi:hypothetical protein
MMRNSDSSRPRSILPVGLAVVAASFCVYMLGSTAHTRVMATPPDAAVTTLYDPDPKHLWNRLHQALHIRFRDGDGDRDAPVSADQKFDPNDLDPFFWDRHHPYMLSGPGHREALTLLDEFLDKKGEGLVKEPLKRALLQRDLWALFDWAADPDWPKRDEKKRFVKERGELQSRLGRVLRRLALSAAEIDQLPDNYAAAVKAPPRSKPSGIPRSSKQTGSPPRSSPRTSGTRKARGFSWATAKAGSWPDSTSNSSAAVPPS